VTTDGDQVAGYRGPTHRPRHPALAAVAAASHAELMLEARDASFSAGAPGSSAPELALLLVGDALARSVPL
jgi:hypothetical protein